MMKFNLLNRILLNDLKERILLNKISHPGYSELIRRLCSHSSSLHHKTYSEITWNQRDLFHFRYSVAVYCQRVRETSPWIPTTAYPSFEWCSDHKVECCAIRGHVGLKYMLNMYLDAIIQYILHFIHIKTLLCYWYLCAYDTDIKLDLRFSYKGNKNQTTTSPIQKTTFRCHIKYPNLTTQRSTLIIALSFSQLPPMTNGD